jgi:hypothetical protein
MLLPKSSVLLRRIGMKIPATALHKQLYLGHATINIGMSGLEEQIQELEAELTKTPYNKATSKHIGRIKAKIARLRDEAVNSAIKRWRGRFFSQKIG